MDRASLASRSQPSTLRLSKFSSIRANRRLSFETKDRDHLLQDFCRETLIHAVLFDVASLGSLTASRVLKTRVHAVRRIDSAFLNGDYVFALRGGDRHDLKIISRSVVRESRACTRNRRERL